MKRSICASQFWLTAFLFRYWVICVLTLIQVHADRVPLVKAKGTEGCCVSYSREFVLEALRKKEKSFPVGVVNLSNRTVVVARSAITSARISSDIFSDGAAQKTYPHALPQAPSILPRITTPPVVVVNITIFCCRSNKLKVVFLVPENGMRIVQKPPASFQLFRKPEVFVKLINKPKSDWENSDDVQCNMESEMSDWIHRMIEINPFHAKEIQLVFEIELVDTFLKGVRNVEFAITIDAPQGAAVSK